MTDSLTRILDIWTSQAVAASFFLTPFYRRLQDEPQASRAMRASQAPLDRVQQVGLGGEVQLRLRGFKAIPDETDAEAHAWRSLVAALGGLSAFYAFAAIKRNGRSPAGLLGPKNAFRKGLTEALRGFRTAFPEEMAKQGIESALEEVAEAVANVLVQASEMDAPEEARAELRRIILESFHPS